jgi:membrane protein YdbS with pleckstrin-like domain
MDKEDLLDDEKVEKRLSPHPLSFMKLQSLCIFLIVWGALLGWFANFSEWKDTLFSGFIQIIFSWSIVLLIVGIIASLLTIHWRIFFLYLGVVAGGVGLIFWQNWQGLSGVVLPYYTVIVSIIGFLIVELYRRSHKYIISNLRITFKGGILTKRVRTLRYDKITDIDAKQGIVGQIFGFGTITPISQSGFGLGSDKSFAAGGVGAGGKKTKVLGIFGGGKEVQTPRARSYYELHGVYPYKEIHKLVENMVQGNVITPYQQEQVAFQKQQVGLQKQMRDLLKKQTGPKDEQEQESEEENS